MYDFNNGLYFFIVEKAGLVADAVAVTALYIALTVVTVFIAYALGSINTAILVSKLLYRDDIRNHGSKNAGMTNILRTYGTKAALITLIGDIMKTVLAVIVGGVLLGFGYRAGIALGAGGYIAAISAVVGHIFPLFHGFKGGKGVLSTAAAVLVLSPPVFLIMIAIFAIIFLPSKYISLGSVSAAALLPVVFNGYIKFVFGGAQAPLEVSLVTIAIAILIVWRHKDNLVRISNRTERKFSIGNKKPPQEHNEDEE